MNHDLDAVAAEFGIDLNEPDDDPCPHDCAVGVDTIGTTSIPLSPSVDMLVPAARTIWECTVCHAIGEDTADGESVVWADAE